MTQRTRIRSLNDIKEERLRITEKRKDLEQNLFSLSENKSSAFIESSVIHLVKKYIFNKFFLKKNDATTGEKSSNAFTNSFRKFDKWGITSVLSQIFSNPIAQSAFTMTKRSFIKWQIFNISTLLIRWGYQKYKRNKLEKKIKDNFNEED